MRSVSIILAVLGFFSTGSAAADEPGLDLVLQSGHTAAVTSAAFVPNGKWLVTGSEDETSILWDVATGKVQRTFKGKLPTLSSDGKLILTVNADSAILSELVSGKTLQSFECDRFAHCAALTSDGKQVITGGGNAWSGPAVWDAAAGKKIKTLEGRLEFTSGISVSENGKIIFSSTREMAVVWGADSGKILRSINMRPPSFNTPFRQLSNTSPPVCVWAISSDGSSLIVGDQDGKVSLYRPDEVNGPATQTLPVQDGSISCVALSKNAKLAVTACAGPIPKLADDKVAPRVIVWDATNGKKLQTIHEGASSVALSTDGKQLVIGSGTNAVLYEVASGKKIRTFAGHGLSFSQMVVSRDGKRIVSDTWPAGSAVSNTVLLWDASGSKRIDVGSLGHGFSVSGDGRYLLSSGFEKATLWETAESKKRQTFEGSIRLSSDAALSGDGKIAVTRASDGTGANVWDVASGKKIASIKEDATIERAGFLTQVAYSTPFALSANGKFLVTGSLNGRTAHLWDTASGKKLQTFIVHDKEIRGVAVSEDGKRVIAFTSLFDGRRVIVWDAKTGNRIVTFDLTSSWMGVLSCDGKHVLAGENYGMDLAVWDASSGKKSQKLPGHTNQIVGAALNADGNLWTASQDGTIRLWNPDGKERCRLYSFDKGKDWLVVTPDGLFDGSPGALRFVAHREPGTLKLVEDDATRKRFHQPGLLGKLWKARKTMAEGAWAAPAEAPNSGRSLLANDGQCGTIRRFFVTADGATLVTDGFDQIIRFWDAKTGKLLKRFDDMPEYGNLLSVSPDGKSFLTSRFNKPGPVLDDVLTLWDAATGRKIRFIELTETVPKEKNRGGRKGSPHDGIFSPDGKTLAIASEYNANYHFFDLASGKETRRVCWYEGESDMSQSPPHYRWSPDGKHLAGLYFKDVSGSLAYYVALWDMTTPKPQVVSEGGTFIRDLAFTGDGKYLAWSDDKKQAHVWDVRAGRKVKTFDATESWAHLAFSPDGRFLIAGRTLYPLKAENPTLRLPFDPRFPAFLPDNQTLLVVSPEHNVVAFNTSKLKKIE